MAPSTSVINRSISFWSASVPGAWSAPCPTLKFSWESLVIRHESGAKIGRPKSTLSGWPIATIAVLASACMRRTMVSTAYSDNNPGLRVAADSWTDTLKVWDADSSIGS